MTATVSVLAGPAATTASNHGSSLGSLVLPLILVVGVIFMFRQQRRARARLTEQASASLVPGTQVVTRGGMIGTVVSVSDDEVLLEVAAGVRIKMLPGSIARPLHPQPEQPASDETDIRPQLPPEDQPPAGPTDR